MLVLTRRAHQSISIAGGLISIKVLRVRGGSVKLGIQAPGDIPVNRAEIEVDVECDPQGQEIASEPAA